MTSRKKKAERSEMIIKDPSMGKFIIIAHDDQYIVQPIDAKGGGQNLYYSNLASAVSAIAKRRVIGENTQMTLSQYIQAYKDVSSEVTDSIRALIRV